MRIISGKNKGRPIIAPKNLPVRPTTDFAKEALFSILNNYFYFEDISVLDLFSGTGCIAYEFESRGTKNIVAVDKHYDCIKFINKTISTLNITNIQAIHNDAFKFLKYCSQTFDIIFADPPFDFSDTKLIPDIIFENNFLKQDGWLIVEHSKNNNFKEHPRFIEERKYGQIIFSIFK